MEGFSCRSRCGFVWVKFELVRVNVTRGHRFKLSVPVCHLEIGRRRFGVRCVTLWNSLPPSLVESETVESFKRGLDLFLDELLYLPFG